MPQELVKSAARAIELLEAFAARRQSLTAAQIGADLDYPRSSLNVLLKSLVTQGYLSFHPQTLSYFPTLRVAQLGDWLPAMLVGSERMKAEMRRLRDRTGETVTLTMPAGLEMRVLHALIGTAPIALHLGESQTFSLAGTAVGTAFLSTLEDKALEKVLGRLASARGRNAPLDVGEERAEIETARKLGYAVAYDRVLPDAGAIAVPVDAPGSHETVVLAVAGLNHRIRTREPQILAELLAATRRLSAPR